MDKLDSYKMQSPDLNAERLKKLKELFPDIFTGEGKLNPEELKKIAAPGSVKETEHFEFKWFGKAQAKRIAFTPSKGALVYDDGRSINPGKADGNLILEGENLEVLKLLLCSYREKIKCIYIDPPYNTGKDFVYSDNYTEDRKAYWEQNGTTENGVKVDTNTETDGRFHSNWLDMMYSRLLIARQLLREDGVIFVSIDDNEVHHLRMLMNEVFGEENFIANVIWKKTYGGGSKVKFVVDLTEYILCFGKNIDTIPEIDVPPDPKARDYYTGKDEKYETRGPFRTQPLATNSMDERPNLRFPILWNSEEIWPDKQWQWSKERVFKALENNELVITKQNGKWSVRYKQYLFDEQGNERTAKLFSLIENIYTQVGTNQLVDLFGEGKIFTFPKPSDLIKHLFKFLWRTKDAIILDFFAGSGTTAQAVMELNKEDGGNRKFILVQLPEFTDEKSEAYKAGYKKISDITIERTKRTIEKLVKEQTENPTLFTEIRKEFGFKVYRLKKSAFPRVEFATDPEKSEEENIDMFKQYVKEKEASLFTLFNEREIIDEVLLKNGFMLDYSIEPSGAFKENKVYLVKDNYKEAFICLDTGLKSETVEYFKTEKDRIFICLERALDTTKKWNLKHYLGDTFNAF